jgi:hypothetical protein
MPSLTRSLAGTCCSGHLRPLECCKWLQVTDLAKSLKWLQAAASDPFFENTFPRVLRAQWTLVLSSQHSNPYSRNALVTLFARKLITMWTAGATTLTALHHFAGFNKNFGCAPTICEPVGWRIYGGGQHRHKPFLAQQLVGPWLDFLANYAVLQVLWDWLLPCLLQTFNVLFVFFLAPCLLLC